MSNITEKLVGDETSLSLQTRTAASTTDWLQNVSTVAPKQDAEIIGHLTDNKVLKELPQTFRQLVLQSTTEIAQNLQHLTTRTVDLFNNNSHPEVTIRKPEITSESESFGTAEKVVVGAAIVVALLAIIALLLRILGPLFRSQNKNTEVDKVFSPEVFISKLSYTNIGADITSQSSGTGNTSSQDCSQSTGSSPVTDWSDLSVSRSSCEESEDNMSGKHHVKEKKLDKLHGRYSSASLPSKFSSEDRFSAKNSPSSRKKLTDEQMSVVSTQSLEPLRLEQQYRDRWDDQFDPCGSLPRGNLSYTSHPSESRQSLNSLSSGSSYQNTYPTFPIPSKELVRQIHMDKERRYPSNTPGVKKEKHVRMSPHS